MVENTSKLPSPDASFNTITFIAASTIFSTETAVLRRLAPTLRSERPYHAHQSLSTIVETLVCLGVFGDKDQRQRDLTEGEVFGFTHRELVGPMTHAGFKFQSRQAFFTRCLNALYVFGC